VPKRKNKTRNRLLDYLAYQGVRIFAMFVHMFPVRTNYHTAAIIGNLMWRLDHRHRNRAIEHIRRSFPDWSQDKLDKVSRASMRNMVYLGVEFLFTTRLVTPGRWRNHIRLVNMAENLRLLIQRKRGMILLTGHFGNWEVLGYTMAALGLPTYSVARRLDNPYLDRYVFGVREDAGQTILDKRGATAEVPDLLANNQAVGFIADQDAGRKGLFVDFFGRPASTYKSIGLLAMEYNVPVVVGFGRRRKEAYTFDIGIEDIIHPEDWAEADDPLRYITQRYTHALEAVIRTAPEQYLWVHRRWKHRPKGEQPGPDGIA
jgi:Kdo2-lipid IVA lauroyltransferase/acyltransferase